MKITSNYGTLGFKSQTQIVEIDKQQKEKKNKYVDPLANWPLRGLGYTNDIGIAINELAPSAARLFWVPALMYFGADIYDKYKNKGNKYKPNGERALNQAVFQACASIVFPALFGHIGMNIFSQIDKLRGNKLTTNAKEQTLRFIKGHSALHEVLEEGKDKTEVISDFINNFNKYYKAKRKAYKQTNLIAKFFNNTIGNGKKGAVANSNEIKIKEFAKNQFIELLEHAADTETAKKIIDKKIFKLKAWKSAGAFTAILLTAKGIDTFVEKVIIKKFVKPQIARLHAQTVSLKDFSGNSETK